MMHANSEPEQSGLKHWAPLLAVCLAMFITVVDSTMMNVAVPAIVSDLDTVVSAVQSTISLYSLVMAALMLTGGKLGAIFGVRRMFVIGVIIYAVGTLFAALSWNISSLAVGWSLLEGIGAALIVPLAFTLIFANYEGSQRAMCFGILAGVQASAAAVGPILGGVLTTYLSWRWGFGGEVIIAALILPLVPYMAETKSGEPPSAMDWWGTVLSTIGMLLVVLGFLTAGRYGWWDATRPLELMGFVINPFGLSPTPLLLVFGVFILVAFLHWQFYREANDLSPLVRTRLFGNTKFMAGAITFIMRSAFLSGLLFVLPLFMQSGLEFTAFQSGLAILPFSIATFVVSLGAASWNRFISSKSLIQIGLICFAIGILICYWSISLSMTISSFSFSFLVMGMGLGLVMSQLVNLTLSNVHAEDTAEASGVNNALGDLGNAFGTAVIGSLLLSFFISGTVNDIARTADLELTVQERNRLIAELGERDDLETEEGQLQILSDLPQNVQDDLPRIFDDNASGAMQDTLMVILLIILLTMLVATFLPYQIHSSKKAGVDIPNDP